MLNTNTKLGHRIAELSKDRDRIHQQINPDDPQGNLLAGTSEVARVFGTLTITKKELPDAFVMNHTTLSVLDDATKPFDEGYQGEEQEVLEVSF